jgi:hypothetical protein
VGLAPDEVRAVTINLPVSQLASPGGIQVQAMVDTQNDANNANNYKGRIIRLTPAGG